MRVGKDVHLGTQVLIDASHCWLITIEDGAILAPRVMIIAHDASTKPYIGYTRIGRVCIGRGAFVGAGSIILPGVTIGDNAVVGAGSVVTRSVCPGVVVAGNPAVEVGRVENYIEKHRARLEIGPRYPAEGWTLGGGITEGNKQVMSREIEGRGGYVE
jgi:maltose O-acetyltransferase